MDDADPNAGRKGLTLFSLLEGICLVMPLAAGASDGQKFGGVPGSLIGLLVGAMAGYVNLRLFTALMNYATSARFPIKSEGAVVLSLYGLLLLWTIPSVAAVSVCIGGAFAHR